MRYYFYLLIDGEIAIDEDGKEIKDLQEVEEEVAHSLVAIATDYSLEHGPNAIGHCLEIHVRTEDGPVLEAKLVLDLGQTIH